MRIVLHGQQAFGQAVLERLLERGEDVVLFVVRRQKKENLKTHWLNWRVKKVCPSINLHHGKHLKHWS